MNPTRAQVGAAACVNGYITGEWCGAVYGGGLTVRYIVDGWNTWARNVVEVDALGNTCPTHGDSGAPVYHKRSDGKVIAYGIFSGSGPLIAACSVWMTDIWDAWYGLHGTLQVTG